MSRQRHVAPAVLVVGGRGPPSGSSRGACTAAAAMALASCARISSALAVDVVASDAPRPAAASGARAGG